MKKIGIIFEDGRMGGPQKQILYFLDQIKKQKSNFEYHIIIPTQHSKYFKKITKYKNVKIMKINITTPSFHNIKSYLKNFFIDCLKIQKLIKKNRYHCVYVAGGSACFKSVLCSRLFCKKIIWHIHDAKSNLLIRLIFKFIKKIANKIIFASEKSRDYYLGKSDKMNNLVLRSSLDLNYFKKKKTHSIRHKKINIALLGNISPDKNIELYFKIVNKFLSKKINFYLIGNLWKSQKKYFQIIKNRNYVAFKKIIWIENNFEIKSLLDKIDLLICTSSNESMPLSVCESLSMNIPVISTDVGDLRKIIYTKNLTSGIIINDSDSDSFVKHLEIILKNDIRFNLIKNNSRKLAIKFFDIRKYTNKLENLFFNI